MDAQAKMVVGHLDVGCSIAACECICSLPNGTPVHVEEKKEKDEKDGLSKVEATSPELKEAQEALKDFKSSIGLLNEDGTPRSRENSQYDRAMDRIALRKEQLKKKRGIASGLKSLSQKGALTQTLLEEARERSAMAGVSDDQFNTFLEKNGIRLRGSAHSYKKPRTGTGLFDTPRKAFTHDDGEVVKVPQGFGPLGGIGAGGSTGAKGVAGEAGDDVDLAYRKAGSRKLVTDRTPSGPPNNSRNNAPIPMSAAEAAENVAYQREHGTGLSYFDAMQKPNYVFGSASTLKQPARPVGPKSARLRSMARRLKRSGNPYWRQAQYEAENMRLGESSINTPADNKRRADQRQMYASEARDQLDILGQSGEGVY